MTHKALWEMILITSLVSPLLFSFVLILLDSLSTPFFPQIFQGCFHLGALALAVPYNWRTLLVHFLQMFAQILSSQIGCPDLPIPNAYLSPPNTHILLHFPNHILPAIWPSKNYKYTYLLCFPIGCLSPLEYKFYKDNDICLFVYWSLPSN